MAVEIQPVILTQSPDRVIIWSKGLSAAKARRAALSATYEARSHIPRVTGYTARRLQPLYGKDYFGILFPDPQVWYLDQGTAPQVMTSLQGKTIPMWVSDDDGKLRQENPKIKQRQTEDGRLQVLIFRRATKVGQPGRIRSRDARGRITSGGGVRWRNPGVRGKHFLADALLAAITEHGIRAIRYYVTDSTWRGRVSAAA